MSHPQPLHICGPTASGKSTFALAVARAVGGEIVNADAFQLYHGIETISAAPSEADRSQAPHHLYGVLAPSESCDAQRYANMAQAVIAEIIARGKTPVVTGGSGLYLKFLTHGASPLPSGDPVLRAELDSQPLGALLARLEELDPVEAARINRQNRRYVTRALEICLLSGQPASALRDAWESATAQNAAALRGFVISRTRADLHARIDARTSSMLSGKALDEVAALSNVSSTCTMAIGIRQIRAMFDGTIDLTTCHDLISAATRQYAKRQETWFRRETWLTPLPWHAEDSLPANWEEALKFP